MRKRRQRLMIYNRAHGIDSNEVLTLGEIRNAEMPDPTEMRHRRQLVLQRRRAADRLSIAVTQEEAQFRLQILKFRRWLQAAEGPEGALGGRVRREAHELLKRAEKGLRSLRGGGK